MLTNIELQNFKAFGEKRAKVRCAPITILFGQNSSGKSSILHALSLIKQSHEVRSSSGLTTRSDNGIIDLGTYSNICHDHDNTKEMCIKLGLSVEASRVVAESLSKLGVQAGAISAEYVFKPSDRTDRGLIRRILIDEGGEKGGVTLEHDEDASRRGREYKVVVDPKAALSKGWLGSVKALFEKLYSERNDQLLELESSKCEVEQRMSVSMAELDDLEVTMRNYFSKTLTPKADSELTKIRNVLKHQISGSASEIKEKHSELAELESQLEETERAAKSILDADLGISEIMTDTYATVSGLFPRNVSLGSEMLQKQISSKSSDLDWASMLEEYLDAYSNLMAKFLRRLFPIAPIQREPSRWYASTDDVKKDVGAKGEHLPTLLFQNERLLHKVNHWLEKLDVNYEISVNEIGEHSSGLLEVLLKDTRRADAAPVGMPDVGYGISQVLPMITQAVLGRRMVFTVEQPEVHIHPKLQADLGSLLADSVKQNGNQFILETHSETLILRLLKLIRNNVLENSDVAIHCVCRGEEGSEVVEIPIDEEGRFMKNPPIGFFDERLDEMIG